MQAADRGQDAMRRPALSSRAGHRNKYEAPIAAHNLMRAHGAAVKVYREVGKHDIGLVVNLEPKYPVRDVDRQVSAHIRRQGGSHFACVIGFQSVGQPDDRVERAGGRRKRLRTGHLTHHRIAGVHAGLLPFDSFRG